MTTHSPIFICFNMFRAFMHSVYFSGKLYCKCHLSHNYHNGCNIAEPIQGVSLANHTKVHKLTYKAAIKSMKIFSDSLIFGQSDVFSVGNVDNLSERGLYLATLTKAYTSITNKRRENANHLAEVLVEAC